MAGFYKWNVEQITNLARKVESEAGDLQRDSQNLDRLKQDVKYDTPVLVHHSTVYISDEGENPDI